MKINKRKINYIMICGISILIMSTSVYLSIIGIFVLLLYIYIHNMINYHTVYFKTRASIWFLFPIGILFANNSGDTHWIKPFVTFFLLTILAGILNLDGKENKEMIETFVFISEIGAVSVLAQFIFPHIYDNNIYSFYGGEIKQVLIEQIIASSYYSGFFVSPSIAATIIVCGIFFLYTYKEKRKVHWIILFLGLFATGKRSHLIFTLLSLGIFYLIGINDQKKTKKILKIAGIVIGIFIGTYFLINYLPVGKLGAIGRSVEAIRTVMKSTDEAALNYATAGRYSTYLEAWEYFLQHPLRGIGWNQFSAINYNQYLGTNLTNVHNIYIQLLCDSGIVGFFCFLIPALYSIRRSRKKDNTEIDNFSLIYQIFFLLFGITETVFDFFISYFIYYICLSISLGKNIQK